MNVSNYECSSGCESGWTTYFDQNSNSITNPYNEEFVDKYEGSGTYVNENREEEEDLSMVSDASSGPPNYQEYEYNCDEAQYVNYGYASSVSEGKKKKNQKSKTKEPSKVNKQHNLGLDDTASSPVFHFSEGNVAPSNHQSLVHVPGFSRGFSATHHEDESTSKKNFGFFRSSTKGKSSGLLGRKRQ